MREALAGLTTRGRAFLAAGLTAVVCALVLDQTALTRAGVLVIALPLATAALVARRRYRLSLTRTIEPVSVPVGRAADVTLTIANTGHSPDGALLLEEQLPYVLGSRPRFLLEGIGAGWRRRITYQVRSEVRGRHQVGPMTVRLSDPFGLVEIGRSFAGTDSLLVTPRTTELSPVPLAGGWTGSGDHRPRAFALGSAEDVTIREYRQGDDLRRVHWGSSARVGELMVRREEQPWQSRATLLLDNRTRAHRGSGLSSSFEAAVSLAASVAVHLDRRGFSVRLVTASGLETSGWHLREAGTDAGPLLEAMALARLVPAETLDTSWLGEESHSGLTVAVLGSIADDDTRALRRLQHHTTTALALTLTVGLWARPAVEEPPADVVLRAQGWRAAALGPRDRFDDAWRELGARGARGGAAVRPGVEHGYRGPQVAR